MKKTSLIVLVALASTAAVLTTAVLKPAALAHDIVVDIKPGVSKPWFVSTNYVVLKGVVYTTAPQSKFKDQVHGKFPKGNAVGQFKVGSVIVVHPQQWGAFTNELPTQVRKSGTILFKR